MHDQTPPQATLEDTDLEQKILHILNQHPQGISEFELHKALQQIEPGAPPQLTSGDSLHLFRKHFLLFHALYRLRDRLFDDRAAVLDIHTLNIQLQPWHHSIDSQPTHHDPLRTYYLDLTHLQNTTQEDVNRLLGSFWKNYSSRAHREEALIELGLECNASSLQIEAQYRKLAMTRHPDRGGNKDDFSRLQQAITILRQAK